MNIRFTKLENHHIETTGDVPISIVVTLYCARDDLGRWFISKVYVDEVVSWFDPDQGDDVILGTDRQVERFVKTWYGTVPSFRDEKQRERYVELCGLLDAAETAQRERGEVIEIH